MSEVTKSAVSLDVLSLAELYDLLAFSVRCRKVEVIGTTVEALRLKGLTYKQIFERAQKTDSTLSLAEWDAILEEADES